MNIGKVATVVRYGTIVLIAAIIGAAALQIVRDRRGTLDQASVTAENLTSSIGQNTRQLVDGMNLILAGLVTDLRMDQPNDLASPDIRRRLLRQRSKDLPYTSSFYILDAWGNPIGSSEDASDDGPSAPQLAIYDLAKAGGMDGLIVGKPSTTHEPDGPPKVTFHVARRIVDEHGVFQGVIGAEINVSRLQRSFEAFNVGGLGLVALYLTDGSIIARAPPLPPGRRNANIVNSPLLREHLPHRKQGVATWKYAFDGVRRITSFEVVGQNDSFIVVVALDEDAVLSAWHDRSILTAAFAIVLCATTLILAALVIRALRERERANAVTLERLRALSAASADLLAIREIPALLDAATTLARDLTDARLCTSILMKEGSLVPANHAVSMHDIHAKWRGFQGLPDGSGIYGLVFRNAKPLRLSRSAFENHPDRKGFGPNAAAHPPISGLLAVPLRSREGTPQGVILLSDCARGDFDATDESVAEQLARVVSVAVDNVRLLSMLETARARAESATDEFQRVFNAMSDAVIWIDAEWRVSKMNENAEILFRRNARELAERELWAVFPELDTPLGAALRNVMVTGAPMEARVNFEPLGVWLDVRAYRHKGRDADIGGISIFFRDVSELVRIESRLRHAQQLEAIGKLTGGVAHDFNNLLTVILGNADQLAARIADPQQRRLAEMIRAAGMTAAEITQRLLAFARRQPLNPRTIRVQKKLTALRPLLQRTLGDDIRVDMKIHGEPSPVVIDPVQFETAVLNLVVNSRDATPRGGQVSIEARNETLDAPQAMDGDHAASGEYVVVSVSDTGTGMTPDVLASAFDPFFTTKEIGKGTGLGLSMVYGFMRQSRGHVKIESEAGHGTTVKLFLPAKSDAVQTSR